jgi:TolB-like protein/DNA-binding winged helix-turn-helix (wHTH) protein/Tfp pilus assembly protein PilF
VGIDIPGFHLDTRRRVLLVAATREPVPLTVKAFDLLLVLIERHGEVVSKDELLRLVWPRVVVEENNLERHVSMLRRALGEKPGENRYIATVPGQGYRFVATVDEATPDPDGPATTAPVAAPAAAPKRPRYAALAIGGLAFVLALVASAVLLWPRAAQAPAPSAAPSGATVAPSASLAVLPFTNLSGEPDKDYLGDGIAEELIHRLTRGSRLTVPARTSSFAYKGRNVDLRQVGRDLGVAWVLEGSVRSGAGERVRVTVQLVDAATGYHVWSQSYERPFGDVFALQDELAAAVLQRLSPGMQAGGTTGLESGPPTRSVEAYRLFLQANAIVAPGEESLARALSLYDRALALDPDFARALVARSTTRISQLLFGSLAPGIFAAAERDARRALELEPTLAAAHAVVAQIEALRGNWAASLRAFEEARRLDGTDPLILVSQSTTLASTGRLKEAAAIAEEAMRLAPLSISPLLVRAQFHNAFGEDAQARALVDRALALGALPNVGLAVIVRSETAARAGQTHEAAAILAAMLPEEARAAGAEAVLAAVYDGWFDPTKRPAARRALHDLTARVPLQGLDRRAGTLLMTLHTMSGDLDAAYAAANGALDARAHAGTIGLPWFVLWMAPLEDFRRDPRFDAFTRRLHLPEYWAIAGKPETCEWRQGAVVCAAT